METSVVFVSYASWAKQIDAFLLSNGKKNFNDLQQVEELL